MQFDEDPEDECPKCHTVRKRDPSMKLFYANCCDSRLCENCIAQIYARQRYHVCLTCGEKLEKLRYKSHSLALTQCRQEAMVRKRVNAVYNSFEDEFDNKRMWNDYLEMVEDLVYDLVHGDVKEKRVAEDKIRQHRRANKELIQKNHARRIVDEQARGGHAKKEDVQHVVETIQALILPPSPNLLQTFD